MKLTRRRACSGQREQAEGRHRAGGGQTAGRQRPKATEPRQKENRKGLSRRTAPFLWLSQIGMFRDYTMPCAIIACATFSKPAMFAPATRL